MAGSDLEALHESIPDLAEAVGEIAFSRRASADLEDDLSLAESEVSHIGDAIDEAKKHRVLIVKELIDGVRQSNTLSAMEKIAFAATLRHKYLRSALEDKSKRSNRHELLAQFGQNYGMFLDSLKAVDSVTRRPDQPVLYCEIYGGTSYWSIGGPADRPDAHSFFEARTTGNGLTLDADFDRLLLFGSTVSFNVHSPSSDTLKNFVSGYDRPSKDGSGLEIEMRDSEYLAGTAVLARNIIRQSMGNLQTNPVFVGKRACSAAMSEIAQQVPRQQIRS